MPEKRITGGVAKNICLVYVRIMKGVYRLGVKPEEQKYLLECLREATGLSWKKVAEKFSINKRTLNDWHKARTRAPRLFVEEFAKIGGVNLDKTISFIPEYKHTSIAGKVGAKRQRQRHVNPGTLQGRIKGGMNAIAKMKNSGFPNKFINTKSIIEPSKSSKVAELIGIILGDGHIDKYQISITLDLTSDLEYAPYVSNLFYGLFGIEAPYTYRNSTNTINIVASSKLLIDYFKKLGLSSGNKIIKNVGIPRWIKDNKYFLRSCLRGLIDTDGCLYADKHVYKSKKYKHLCIQFDSHSSNLLKDVYESLMYFDYGVCLYQGNIKIRRQGDVKKFYKEICFSNPKNLAKYAKFSQNI